MVSICILLAPIERSRVILFLSVAKKPLSIFMTATMMPTSTVINMMADEPEPNQTMITGPSAIFGRLFKTTI